MYKMPSPSSNTVLRTTATTTPSTTMTTVILLSLLLWFSNVLVVVTSLGPKYPVTAAYFRDRWTGKEWQDALDQFAAQGGDTVFTRTPPVIRRTREDLESDPDFRWCGNYKSPSGTSGPKCYDEAVQELKATMGLNVTSFLTYQNEEGYSDAIMRCPKLDRKINSSRVYYRIVLPARHSTYAKSDPCAFANGSNVVVLFTSFAGVDPHQLLLETVSASSRYSNVSVYFGLPGLLQPQDDDLMPAYYAWVEHVLFEHRSRFSNMAAVVTNKLRAPTHSSRTTTTTTSTGTSTSSSGGGGSNRASISISTSTRAWWKKKTGILELEEDDETKRRFDTNTATETSTPVSKFDEIKTAKTGNLEEGEETKRIFDTNTQTMPSASISKFDRVKTANTNIVQTQRTTTTTTTTSVDSNYTLYDKLSGYNAQCDHSLGEWLFILYTVNIYEILGSKVNMVQKDFAVSATVNLNKGQVNSSAEQHVQGFLRLVRTGVIDMVIVQEGRGMGKGAYFWPDQRHKPISQVDSVLDKILHLQNKTLAKHATFDDVFITSNQAIFASFWDAFQAETHNRWDNSVQIWLGLEAFEDLRDDPCLPIDPRGSGMDQLFNRATKGRLDQGIGVAGSKVHKVISLAWDPEFTCVTNEHNTSLHADIMADADTPIIANCSFHSPQNLSVVLIGFNLEGETQGFTVGWKDTRGHEKTAQVNGYYFELDYGIAHHLVTSLQYVMLWDIPQMFPGLAPDGNVSVVAKGGNACFFEYHLPE